MFRKPISRLFDALLRMYALRCAVLTGPGFNTYVDRAKEYYQFLSGDSQENL